MSIDLFNRYRIIVPYFSEGGTCIYSLTFATRRNTPVLLQARYDDFHLFQCSFIFRAKFNQQTSLKMIVVDAIIRIE